MVHAPEENEETRKTIADVKDMIADMEQRVRLNRMFILPFVLRTFWLNTYMISVCSSLISGNHQSTLTRCSVRTTR